MNLIYYPNEFLTKEVKDVNVEKPELDFVEIKKNMTDIMLQNGGIGLSANQVGLDAKLFIMGENESNISLIINPKVLQHTKDTVLELEGCLSFPNVYVKVTRPKEILVEYYDETLELKRTAVKGYTTKVFLHEWDHLHGITFKDRVSKLKWDMATKKAKKIKGKQR
tara:strand:+ start:501 stop:998 length:498 start_codon:yes stop_codon:yes gene_type:complete